MKENPGEALEVEIEEVEEEEKRGDGKEETTTGIFATEASVIGAFTLGLILLLLLFNTIKVDAEDGEGEGLKA